MGQRAATEYTDGVVPESSSGLSVSSWVELRRFPLWSFPSNPQELVDDVGKPSPLGLPKGMRAIQPLYCHYSLHTV